ncbi:MAG: hypothetical protein ACPGSD_02860 [Flavobacteriales bacterium]
MLLLISCNLQNNNLKSFEINYYSDSFTDAFLNKTYSFNFEYWFVKDSIFARNRDILSRGCNHVILLGVVGQVVQTEVVKEDGKICGDYYFPMYHSETILSNGCIKSELTTLEGMSHSLPDSVLPIQARIIEFDKHKKIKNIKQITKDIYADKVGFGW